MKRKSQLLALLMALCLLASLAVVPAAADEPSNGSENPGSSSTTTPGGDTGTTTPGGDSGTTTPGGDSGTTTPGGDSGTTTPGGDSGTTTPGGDSGTTTPGGDSGTTTPGGDSGTTTPGGDSGTTTPGGDSGTTAPGGDSGTTTPGGDSGTTTPGGEQKPPVDEKPEQPTITYPKSSDFSYPSSVNFGTLEKNASSGSRTQTFTIKNKSDYEMKLSYSTPSGYSISGLPSSLTAGSSSTVTVQLNSASSTGNYDRRLTITASFVGGSGSNDFSVNLYATVVEKGYTITVDPTSKDLGKLKEGYTEKEAKEKEITVTVQNKGASNVRMDTVKGNDHFIVTAVKSDSVTLENGDKAEYKIVPKQDLKVGTYTDTITFQTRENTSATFKATVVIEKKLAPLTVEPGTLDFGIVEEGYTALAQKTVTVKNNTEYAIRLDQPTSYSYEVSLLTQTSLPAGGSTTFTIRPRTGLPANAYNGVVELYGSGESAKVNVQFAVTKPAGPSTFSDVAAGSTFAADIAYVSQKGLMSGVGEGRFNPGAPVTRGQLVTILYRLEGQPAVSGAGFPDVAAGSYCEKSVKWAAANGITAGGKDGLFRPGDSITREQLATFLFRYNAYKGYVSTQRANLADFSDGAAVASYAKEALSWANAAKLVNGTSDGRLNPSGGATRGQAAAILHRFCVSIGR